MRRGIISVLVLCLILVGSVACDLGGGNGEGSQRSEKVVRCDLKVTVSGSGNIDVSNEVELAFGSGGKVDKIYVNEGDEVSKGDMLAKLDTGALELALAQAQVALDEAEYNLNQLRDVLHASYDRIKIAEAQLEAAEQDETAERDEAAEYY